MILFCPSSTVRVVINHCLRQNTDEFPRYKARIRNPPPFHSKNTQKPERKCSSILPSRSSTSHRLRPVLGYTVLRQLCDHREK
ncbi:hypothetical protein QR685DRAFT_597335 [Neurospora intermedia]|uniref:Uncharacterized protein n=1 Tax=Neurospora intermedia TaxID=5142 RepID=A0ABR3DDK6_NEUIN